MIPKNGTLRLQAFVLLAIATVWMAGLTMPALADEADDQRDAVKELCSILPQEITLLVVASDAGELPAMFGSDDDLLEKLAQWLAVLFPRTPEIEGARRDADTIARSADATLGQGASLPSVQIPGDAQINGVAVVAVVSTPPAVLLVLQVDHPALALLGACRRNRLMVTGLNPLPEKDSVVQGEIVLSPDPMQDENPLTLGSLPYKCLPGILVIASDASLLAEVTNRHTRRESSPSSLDAMSINFVNSAFFTRARDFLDPEQGLFWAVDLKSTIADAGNASAADFDSLERAGLNDVALFCGGMKRENDQLIIQSVLDFDRDLKAPWRQLGRPEEIDQCASFLGRKGTFAAIRVADMVGLYEFWESVLFEHAYLRDPVNLESERSSAEKKLGFELKESLLPLLGDVLYLHRASSPARDWMVAAESPDPLRLERMIHDAIRNSGAALSEEPCSGGTMWTATWGEDAQCSWTLQEKLMLLGTSKGDLMDLALGMKQEGQDSRLSPLLQEVAEEPATAVITGNWREWVDSGWSWVDSEGEFLQGVRASLVSGAPLPAVIQVMQANRQIRIKATIDESGAM